MQYPFNRRYYAYTITVGLGSFALLLWLSFGALHQLHFAWGPLLLFATLAFVSKFLSFRLMGVVSVSMDTAIYITALLCLGTVQGSWAVFLSMYLKIVWDTVDREIISRKEKRPFLENLTAPLFQGGSGAVVAVAASLILPVDDFVSGQLDREAHVLWISFLLAAAFVTMQYTVVLNKYWLRGYSWRNLFFQVFLKGAWAELILVPLGIVMALVYHTNDRTILPLIFLIATYVIVNVIFKKFSDATLRLNEKVNDLESLNELGRVVCSNLQADTLVPALAGKTLDVIEGTDGVLLYVWCENSGGFDSHFRFRTGFDESLFDRKQAVALASMTADEKIPIATARPSPAQEGKQLTHLQGHKLDDNSWMAVPVMTHDQVMGVLVLFAATQGRYSSSDLGLLHMIGSQAAVALQNSRLFVLATVDGLTRLFVRRYFDRRLAEEAARARRYGTSFAVILLDFDNFKKINDTYGHSTGDEVLQRVAEIVLSEARNIDVPARFGGDEYAVICPEVNWRGALVLANRIAYRVKREGVRAGDALFSFSMSIGLASFPEHGGEDAQQILTAADEALYQAKKLGKSRVVVSGEELPTDDEEDDS